MTPFGSFYYRTALALFLGIFASSIVLVATGWFFVGKPTVQNATRNFAHQIENAVETYRVIPEAERERFRRRLFVDLGLVLQAPGPAALTGERSALPYFHYLEKALSDVGGKPVIVLRRGEIYSFDFPAGAGFLRFSFSHSRLGTEPVLALSIMLALAVISSLFTALLMARHTARPIEAIALRTDFRKRDRTGEALPEEGPRELRDIVRNFNQLSSQNRELINNSAIMLAGISHDLRAPITRARMALELARESMEDDLAGRIERSLIQMETLIAQYLDYVGGSVKERPAHIKVVSTIREILQTYRQADVRLDVPDIVAFLPVRALTRCAQNLLDNALKHGAGEVVDVSFRRTASVYVLDVADRGPGIPEGELEKVFQPFLRLDNARTRLGSGLGLTIVQEICRVQGWSITLTPRTGGGLLARLIMPLAAQGESAAAKSVRDTPRESSYEET